MRTEIRDAVNFSYATQENTRVRTDGQIELASRNLFSNPDLRDLASVEGERGPEPDGVYPDASGEPAGWGYYVRQLRRQLEDGRLVAVTNPISTLQTNVLPMRLDSSRQVGGLIEGETPQDPSAPTRAAKPSRVRVSVADGRAGYAGGFRAICYRWVTGNPNNSTMRTGLSPRTYVEGFDGCIFDVPLPEAAPEGVTAIEIYMTEAQTSENAASAANVWLQRRVDIRGSYPLTVTLQGDFLRTFESGINSPNSTYIGGFGERGWPSVRYVSAPGTLYAMNTRLSYSFLTEFGWSATQGLSGAVNVSPAAGFEGRCPGRGFRVEPPRLPKEAKAWRLEFRGSDEGWYTHKPIKPGNWMYFYTNDPQEVYTGFTPVQSTFHFNFASGRFYLSPTAPKAGEEGGDMTGTPDPDTALGEIVVRATNATPPGVYEVRGVLFSGDGKPGQASLPQNVRIDVGETFVVERPPVGNLIPNATMEQMRGNVPDGWRGTVPANTVVRWNSPDPGSVLLWDTTNRTTAGEAGEGVITANIRFDRTRAHAARVDVDMLDYQGGAAQVIIRFYDASLTQLSATNLKLVRSSQTVEVPFGPGTPSPFPAGAEYALIQIRGWGATGDARSFRAVLSDFAFVEGPAVPRALDWSRSLSDGESAEEGASIVPTGGTWTLVENPTDIHPDLVGKNVSALDYYAPMSTPANAQNGLGTSEDGAGSYRTAVRGGQRCVLSAYVMWRGVTVRTNALRPVWRGADGRVIRSEAGMVSMYGFGNHQRVRTPVLTAPGGAAFVELEGWLSDGYVRVYAFQLDEEFLSAYTNENALSGYRRITIDTGIPGVADDSLLAILAPVKGWLGAGTASTPDNAKPAVTSVTTRFRSTSLDPSLSPVYDEDYSPWTEDWTQVPRKRYWQIEPNLATTDPTASPLVDSVYVEAVRWRPMLLRPDGSEYTGGVQVVNFPPTAEQRVRDRFISDSNVSQRGVRGEGIRMASGWGLQFYLREAFEEFVSDMNQGEMTNLIEEPRHNARYTVHITSEIDSPSFEREVFWNYDKTPHHIFDIDSLECEVLYTEVLAEGDPGSPVELEAPPVVEGAPEADPLPGAPVPELT